MVPVALAATNSRAQRATMNVDPLRLFADVLGSGRRRRCAFPSAFRRITGVPQPSLDPGPRD
jgi:hypothetical protein